jgi:hypothetical protein
LYLVQNDVHADATSGSATHLCSRGKAGVEDDPHHLRGTHLRQLVAREEALATRDLSNSIAVDATPVVRNLDEDHVALLFDTNDERSRTVLASCGTNCRGLDAVIERVANQMNEGALQLFENTAIDG